jgi:hypothetical protein
VEHAEVRGFVGGERETFLGRARQRTEHGFGVPRL